MGSRLTKELLQGVIVPDERITLENIATASSYTEQGARPGVPVPDDAASTLRPIITGAQSADVRAGISRAGGVGEAEFVYRLGTEGANDWRGWGFPSAPVWSGLLDEDTTGANNIVAFDCITNPSTQDVCCCYVNSDADLIFVKWKASTWATNSVVIASSVAFGADSPKAAAIQIQPTGRIVCWAGAVSYYSDDGGTNWASYAEGAYGAVTNSPGRFTQLRVIRVGGDYCAIWVKSGDDTYQYASTDQGQVWRDVGGKVDLAKYIDAAEMPDGSAYLIYVDTDDNVKTIRLTGAYQSISDLSSSALTVATGTYEACAIAADPNGDLYAYARASEIIEGYKLIDGAWVRMTTGLADFQAAANAPTEIAACCTFGSVMLVTDGDPADTRVAGNPEHLRGTLCGGYSTLVGDHTGSLVITPGYAATDAIHYQPIAVPTAGTAWSDTGTSGGTTVVNAEGLSVVGTNEMFKYSFSSASRNLGLICEWGIKVATADTSGTIPVPGLNLRATGATDTTGYLLRAIYRTDSVEIYDVNASAVIITATVDTTVQRLYHLSVTSAGAVVFASRRPSDTVWTVATATATSASIAAGETYVQFGNDNGSTSRTSYWQYVQARAVEDYNSAQLFYVRNQADLVGRPLNGIPTPVPVIGDTAQAAYVHAEGGDAADRAAYTINAAHNYPIENTLPQVAPSPAVGWRSTSTAEQSIVWDLGSSSVTRSYMGKATAVYMDGCNFNNCILESSLDGVSWSTVVAVKFATGLGEAAPFGYSLTGDVVTFTSGEADRYIFGETLRDCYIELIAGDGTTKTRKIAANLSGQLGVTGTTVRPAVRLDAITGSEAATGTCRILSKRCAAVAYDTSLQTMRYIRIRIPASQPIATPSGETGYHIGSIVLGEFMAFGGGTGTGWNDSTSPNYEESLSRRGTRYRRALGPPARRWSLVWDEADRFLDSTSPDWNGNNDSDQPLAARAEIYEVLRAIAIRTSALAVPVVAVRYITATDGSIVYPSAILYGHISGEVELQQVAGDNDWSAQQVVRAGNIQIDEVI